MYNSTLVRGYSFEYKRWVYRCPADMCFYARSVEHEGADIQHRCPQGNGPTKVAWVSYGPTLLQKTWDELDSVMNEIMAADHAEPSVQVTKGYARGLAFTLSLFMVPHFTTPADVSREAKKRWDMRQAGTDYETPGLGSRTYEPPPGDNKYSTVSKVRRELKTPSPEPKPVAPKPEVLLTEAQIVAIKNARVMFTSEELAQMYGTTAKFIESL